MTTSSSCSSPGQLLPGYWTQDLYPRSLHRLGDTAAAFPSAGSADELKLSLYPRHTKSHKGKPRLTHTELTGLVTKNATYKALLLRVPTHRIHIKQVQSAKSPPPLGWQREQGLGAVTHMTSPGSPLYTWIPWIPAQPLWQPRVLAYTLCPLTCPTGAWLAGCSWLYTCSSHTLTLPQHPQLQVPLGAPPGNPCPLDSLTHTQGHWLSAGPDWQWMYTFCQPIFI